MHDSIAGDRRGVPSAAIMTEKFIGAADLMARALGADGYRYSVIEHPISSASADGLAARAIAAADECVLLLTGAPTGAPTGFHRQLPRS